MADQNINNMTVTWNSGGTTFAATKMNVTDTASAAASLLLQFQVGGSDKFSVRKDGKITGAGDLAIAGNATITGNVTINGTLTAAGITGTVTGPGAATDNAIARFNGTTGGVIQNSGVIVDDSNNVTGVASLTASGGITANQNFVSSSANLVLATTGAGGVFLRPNGSGSTTGQLAVNSAGAVTINGALSATSSITANQFFLTATANAILATGSAGTVFLRPNGSGSTTGQMTVASTGNVTINGTLNATDGSNTVQMDSAGRLLIGGPAYTGTVITAVGCSIQGPGATSPGAISSTAQSSACVFLNRQGGDGTINEFFRAGSFVGSVSVSAGATAYNTSSDARLKKNFRSFDSGSIIDALEFGQFEWIDSGKTAFGVLAQDAEGAFPPAISISDDGVYQADYSKYVPAAMAELKDMRRRLSAAGL